MNGLLATGLLVTGLLVTGLLVTGLFVTCCDWVCRTLDNLQLLSHQLTPVLQSFRQQLIDQALHAANTANAATTASDAATAVGSLHIGSETVMDNGDTPHDAAHAAVISVADPAYSPATAATAAGAADMGHATDEVLHHGASPFANLDEGYGPSVPLGVVERQGRRQEYSGSLPLEQMFSRVPSPVGSASGLDRHSSDGLPSRASSRRTSRHLGSSLDLSQLISAASLQFPAAADSNLNAGQQALDRRAADSFSHHSMSRRASRLGSSDSLRDFLPSSGQTQPFAANFPPSGQAQPVGGNQADPAGLAAAGVVSAPAAEQQAGETSARQGVPVRPLRTVYSGQGLPPGPDSSRGDSFSQLTAQPSSPPANQGAEQVASLSPAGPEMAGTQQPSLPEGTDMAGSSITSLSVGRGAAVTKNGSAQRHSSESARSHDNALVAQLEEEAEARIIEQQQHPWLLYFYDPDTERDYSIYHASQMSIVSLYLNTHRHQCRTCIHEVVF